MVKKFILVTLMVLIIVSSIAFATFDPITVTPSAPQEASVNQAVETILGVAQWIGFIVGIAMIIWVGVKYLTSGAGKKAEAKDTLIPIVIGAALVALAPTIARALFNAFTS